MSATHQESPSGESPRAELAGGATTEAGGPAAFHPVLFYLLSIAIAWTAWAPLLLHRLRDLPLPVPYPVALLVCQTIGAFAPVLSLLLVQRIQGDPELVRGIFRKLRFRGVGASRLLLPAMVPPVIAVATAVLNAAAVSPQDGFTIIRPEPLDDLGWALLVVIPFSFVMGMIGSPLGEEPGWRGYVFDRLADRGHGYLGSAIVAAMWWLWHLPLFVVLEVPVGGYSFLELAGHSWLIDAFFLLSGRNLLVAMIYHQAVATSFLFFAGKTQTLPGVLVLLTVAVAVRTFAERRTRRNADRGMTTDPAEELGRDRR